MKQIITIFASIILTVSVYAQAPNKMSYQAVIRNSSNNLVTNSTIGMRISILQTTASGTAVYVETQTPTTNANGLASIEIGGGTVISGSFSTINWANGPYFAKTETDPTGGTNYSITGTSQLLSVPYALYAESSGSSTPGPQGAPGLNSLTNLISEPAGSNCPNGGVQIQVGLDQNMNGTLDPVEINASITKYVCNGNNFNNNGGSSSYYQVEQLYNNLNGSNIAANGYFNPQGYPYQIIHTYDSLNSKEFEFNLLTAIHKCFSLTMSFKFYDVNNTLVNVLYYDKETYASYTTNFGWTNEMPITSIGNSTNPIFNSRNNSNNGASPTEQVLERLIKFKCQSEINKIEIVFGSTNIVTVPSSCVACTCDISNYNGPTNFYGGFYGTIGYQLNSFK